MRKVRNAIALPLIAILSGSCSSTLPTTRYRLTFVFSEDGRAYSGSSVIEAHPRLDRTIDGDFYNDAERGEAPYVRLREGQLIVMVLGRWHVHGGKDPIPLLQQTSHAIALRPDQTPQMLWFQKPDEPASLTFVWPNSAATTLGHNITFGGATLQRTAAPVSHGITRILPWLTFWPRREDVKTRQTMCFPQDSCIWRDNLVEGDL